MARWWKRESRVLAISCFVTGVIQLSVAAFVAVIGITVAATVLILVLSPFPHGSEYFLVVTLCLVIATCAVYPFLRRRNKGYLLSAPELMAPVKVPASLVGSERDPFDSGVRANRLGIVAGIVFALPVALDRAFEAFWDGAVLMRPMQNHAGAVLAVLVQVKKPVPISRLVGAVRCNWSRLLRRLALIPGLQLLPNSGDALVLGDELRVRVSEALMSEDVAFEVSN